MLDASSTKSDPAPEDWNVIALYGLVGYAPCGLLGGANPPQKEVSAFRAPPGYCKSQSILARYPKAIAKRIRGAKRVF